MVGTFNLGIALAFNNLHNLIRSNFEGTLITIIPYYYKKCKHKSDIEPPTITTFIPNSTIDLTNLDAIFSSDRLNYNNYSAFSNKIVPLVSPLSKTKGHL